MRTVIINGVPTRVVETVEEAMEELWSERDEEEFLIGERLDEIREELRFERGMIGEYVGSGDEKIMLQRIRNSIFQLKKERAELRKRLCVLNA